ncbi:ABC transporter ATP-binding protein [Desulfovibrio oxyclinae]|uniref:ABC transporter ATP-binding protein n=1 Tax=Desulfovibrio oxyclinae TaxID=63560 RepID=UPI000399E535|nr:ABC transporter ATP-binding protein [Desulfovibrio oxyclinae]
MAVSFLSIFKRFDSLLKKRVFVALFSSVVVSVLQLVLVSSIALMGAALSSPKEVVSSEKIAWLWALVSKEILAEPKSFIIVIVGLTALVVIFNNGIRLWNTSCSVRLQREVEKFVGSRLLSSLLSLPYEWHVNRNSSDMALYGLWARYYGLVARSVINIACDGFTVIFILFGLLFVDPVVSLGTFGVLSLVGMTIFKFSKKRIDHLSNKLSECMVWRNRVYARSLQGIAEAKIAGCGSTLLDEYRKCMSRATGVGVKVELMRSTPMYLLESFGFILIALSICYLLSLDASYARVAGTAALLAAAGWRLLPCMNKLLDSMGAIRMSWPYIERLEAVEEELYALDLEEKAVNSEKKIPHLRESVQLKGVKFKYLGASMEALSQIDLVIDKGQALGVVGPSGAGKSTLINLLAGLLPHSSGEFVLDGKKLTSEEVRAWQVEEIGYVPQFPYVFDGTIAENIAYGVPEARIDRGWVLECCRMASLDFLSELVDGIDTKIGEHGAKLSGGQRQRLAIARALYKKPEVLIFDEATSSLDSKVEKAILDTVYSFKGELTLIIVAHRNSTVERCDSIVWVESGEIVDRGIPKSVLMRYDARF